MKTTRRWGLFCNICLIITAVLFGFPRLALASQYQQCPANSACTIGEFLYDDNYLPIAVGTTCTLTTRLPNGDLLINAENMPGTADGWYSYSVGTSGLSNGLYRGQMCCLTGTENICLDKTFEISATLSTLVSDIWASPNRSLSDFGNLITNIWSHPTRQLTTSTLENGTSLATTDSLASIGTSLATIESKIDSLQISVNSIQSDTTNILSKWSTYSVTDILNYVDSLETQLGNNTQTCSDDTTFGQIQCLIDKWGTDSASTIYTAANNAYTTATSLRSELNFNGKSTTAYDEIIAIKAYVDTIEGSIGSTADTSATASIFGRIKQVKEAVDAIDNSTLDLNDLLAKWGTYSATDIYDQVAALSTQVAAINTVSNVDNITNNNITQNVDLGDLRNQILAMRALLEVNRLQLEKIDNKPIIKTWLENGSIIFKTLITNPSASVSQDVPFVYYLPPEVKETDIIKKSDNLTIKYDTSKSALSATGDFKLKPRETLILEIEVEDIWSISEEKINSLRRQATELFTPLKKTSYFAQGTTLHSDIQASLDRIVEIQKPSKLPEEKIKDYREAQIELESVNKKMDSLKEIVSSAGSIGTLSGFIGGVQTFGVWGIIVVLVAGFVFLALYIKSLNSSPKRQPRATENSRPPITGRKHNFGLYSLIFISTLSSALVSSLAFNYYLNHHFNQNQSSSPAVLSAVATPSPNPTPTSLPELIVEAETPVPTEIPPTPSPAVIQSTSIKKVVVTPSINSYVNLRSTPDRNSSLVTKILSGQELTVMAEKYNDLGERWLSVSSNQFTGWILAELTQAIQSPSVAPSAKINIMVPSHDTVYLYSRPSFNASITHKITEDQSADILVETKRWAKVILSRVNIEGWVSQDFIQKSTP